MGFLDWVYPPKCMACKQIIPVQEKEWRRFRLCADCRALFETIKPPVCGKCGCPLPDEMKDAADDTSVNGCPSCFGKRFVFVNNSSAFTYDGALRDIMLDIKFHSRKQSAIGLGELWASAIENGNQADVFAGAVLVPVPMHPRKARATGSNQAEILAAAVAKKTGAQMKTDLLKRTVNTPPQSGLSARSRAENVRGVFKFNRKYNIKGMKIILIDDIFTTGASLNACAEVLQDAGAGKITCMTLSAAVKYKDNVYSVINFSRLDDKDAENIAIREADTHGYENRQRI